MNKELGLKVLGQIMGWDNDQARVEFRWLSFMSAYKYDGYHGYVVGARFLESLVTWLQQFEKKEERKIAYAFIKENLIYFNHSEIERLIEKFYPDTVKEELIACVSNCLGIKRHAIWSEEKNIQKYCWEKRKTLFMGLSDGARLDVFRRINANVISNEQVVIST